jgi:hypothetical protein
MSKSIAAAVWCGCSTIPRSSRRRSARGTDTGREVVFDSRDKPGVSNLLSILAAFAASRSRRWRSASRAAGTAI